MKILKNQKGIVLIATLMMSVVLAGIMITLSVVPNGDQKNLSNEQVNRLAQQAANAALQEARGWIQQKWSNAAAPPTGSCSYPNSLPMQASNFAMDNYPTNPLSWWSTNGCSASSASTPAGVAAAPQYIIKQLGCDAGTGTFIYQIVARGVGSNANTVAFAEKIFQVGSNGNLTNVGSSTPGAKLVTPSGPPTNYMPANFWLPLGGSKGIAAGGFPGWYVQACGCCCPSGWPVWFGCERDCQGRLRVYGSSECACGGSAPGCSNQVGPWVPASGGTSSIQMCVQYPSYSSPALHTYSCSQ